MRDLCARQPWGLKRLLRRHRDDTGLVVYGWFNRLRGWTPQGGWHGVSVKVDGKQQHEVLTQLDRGPFWIDVGPGSHRVEFFTRGRLLRAEQVEVSPYEVVLVTFRPPNPRAPLRRLRDERWCVTRVSATARACAG